MLNQDFINYINSINFNTAEGSCIKEEAEYLSFIVSKLAKKENVLEIGFNGGISAAAILSSDPGVKLVSVDLGEHPYVLDAKRNIDKLFPGRHTLIIGNSLEAVPRLVDFGITFDFMFIDGGHIDPVPRKDIENCRKLVKSDEGTLTMIDDWCDAHGCHGVNSAIEEGMAKGFLEKLDCVRVHDRGWGLFRLKK